MNKYLVAYACEPNQGGEHAVGWKVATTLADSQKITVITRKSNQKLIESSTYSENISFVYLENTLGMLFKPKGKFSYLYYFLWQVTVILYLLPKVQKNDLVHYITFGNINLPHFLFLLRCRLIVGPMGGGAVCNVNLIKKPSFILKLKYIVHCFLIKVSILNPFVFLTSMKAEKIFVRTKDTLDIIPNKFKNKASILLETGVDLVEINNTPQSDDRTLRSIVTTAKFIQRKNIDQAIEIFLLLQKRYENDDLTFTIVGDGVCGPLLREKYGHVKGVIFTGKVTNDEVKNIVSKADLFLFCSIHEGGTHSLFEAAMLNVPIACYDISGMQEFPPNNTAIKITPTNNINNNVKSLSDAIIRAFDTGKVDQYCSNAILKLETEFNWYEICKKLSKY